MGDNIQGIPRVLHTKSTAYSKRCILLHPVHTPSMKVSAGPLPVLQTRIVLPLPKSRAISCIIIVTIIIMTRIFPIVKSDHHRSLTNSTSSWSPTLSFWSWSTSSCSWKTQFVFSLCLNYVFSSSGLCCINNYLCKDSQALFTLAEGYRPVCTYVLQGA